MRAQVLLLVVVLVTVSASPLKENPKLVVKLEDGEGEHLRLIPVKLKVGPNKATSVEEVKRLLNEPIEKEPSSSSEEMVKIHAVPEQKAQEGEHSRVANPLESSKQHEQIQN